MGQHSLLGAETITFALRNADAKTPNSQPWICIWILTIFSIKPWTILQSISYPEIDRSFCEIFASLELVNATRTECSANPHVTMRRRITPRGVLLNEGNQEPIIDSLQTDVRKEFRRKHELILTRFTMSLHSHAVETKMRRTARMSTARALAKSTDTFDIFGKLGKDKSGQK